MNDPSKEKKKKAYCFKKKLMYNKKYKSTKRKFVGPMNSARAHCSLLTWLTTATKAKKGGGGECRLKM